MFSIKIIHKNSVKLNFSFHDFFSFELFLNIINYLVVLPEVPVLLSVVQEVPQVVLLEVPGELEEADYCYYLEK